MEPTHTYDCGNDALADQLAIKVIDAKCIKRRRNQEDPEAQATSEVNKSPRIQDALIL